ncbi:hypothetical protein BW14_06035 [Bifidobacterium sp. UTBIF-68]|uniref:hypothetical protein n=1 Tax=Bifidobacterium sp. UTBIF-68 TaxID=1465262 RepID=UPI00112AFD15|nr:hypothetical protein [Bifidobacterium sp. UTBIF-68]TPF93233.1 hypothetical protein BW14_06035 [Bifidobacterium sp. UTBIF-68]
MTVSKKENNRLMVFAASATAVASLLAGVAAPAALAVDGAAASGPAATAPVQPADGSMVVDLSKETKTGTGVYVSDKGDVTPKSDDAKEPLYGSWKALKAGKYTLTYKAPSGDNASKDVTISHRENASYDAKTGLTDLGTAVKEDGVLKVTDPADPVKDEPTSVVLTVKAGDVLLLPSSGEYTFGELTFTADKAQDDLSKGDTDKDGKYTAADLKGVTLSVDGKAVAFDPAQTTVTIPAGSKKAEAGSVPEGWTAGSTPLGDATGWTLTFTAPDGKTKFNYTLTSGKPSTGEDGDKKPGQSDGDKKPGQDSKPQGLEALSIDLSNETKTGTGVYVSDKGDVTPKADDAKEPLYGSWKALKAGKYTLTYKAPSGDNASKDVTISHRENASYDAKTGLTDLGDPVKGLSTLALADPSDTTTHEPKTLTLTLEAGDVLLLPKSGEYTFGTLTISPAGTSDGKQDDQKPGQSDDQGKGSGNAVDQGELSQTGAGVTGVFAMLGGLLAAGLAVLGFRRRRA